jgi:hypothetical protein
LAKMCAATSVTKIPPIRDSPVSEWRVIRPKLPITPHLADAGGQVHLSPSGDPTGGRASSLNSDFPPQPRHRCMPHDPDYSRPDIIDLTGCQSH